MKKIIYAILFAITISMSVTSCTEEQVSPSSGSGNGGGASDPVVG